MFKGLEKILRDVLTKGIYEIIKYLLLCLIAGATGLLYNSFILQEKSLATFSIIVSAICLVVICLLGLVVYRENNPIYNIYKKNDFQFILLEKDLTYDYTDLECIKYEKKVKLKVICDSVDRYHDKYNWTGDCKPKITSSEIMHEILETPKRDTYDTFEVHFGRTYKKGDVIEFKLTFIMEDKKQKSDTRISTTIDEPIRKLRIRIKVSEGYREGNAVATVFPYIDGSHCIYNEIKHFDNDGIIEWITDDPQMLTKYSLIWNSSRGKI